MRQYLLLILLCLTTLIGFSQSAGRGGKTGPAATPATAGTAYGVVVGISAYQHLPRLQFADRDARVFADYLLQTAHVPRAHLEVLIDKQATLVNFSDALTQVRKQVHRGDRVYLYFAGHGDIETRTDSTDNAMLMLVGAASKDYNATFDKIYLYDLKNWLDQLVKAGAKVIFVADACRSGAFVLAGGTLGQSRTLVGLEEGWAGQMKLLACEPGELAIEGPEFGGGRGLFSYYLVDGLMGLADGAGENERDGTITKAELEAYLKAKVSKAARPHVQNPQVLGGEAGLPLGTFNADSLERYQQRKTRDFTLLTAAQTKGLDSDLLRDRDPNTRRLYELFDAALTTRRLLHPANRSAQSYLRQIPQTDDTKKLVGLMTRNLVAALQQRTDNLLRPMLTTVSEYALPLPTAQLDSALAEMDAAIRLLGPTHNLTNNLKARQLFLEGCRLLKTERKLAGTKDSLSLLAEARFRQSAQLEPNMVYTYWKLAETSYVLLEFDPAMHYLEKCRELLPNNIAILYKLSEHYYLRHQNQKAQQLLEEALRIDPNDPDVNTELVDFYYKTGNQKLGKLYTKKALASIDKRFARADQQAQRLYAEGVVLNNSGQFDKAITSLRESLRLDSANAEAYIDLGDCYKEQKNWAAAINTLERMVRRYPDFSVAHAFLGQTYLEQYLATRDSELLQKAQQYVTNSFKLNPGNLMGLFTQTLLFISQKKFTEAVPYARKAVSANPSWGEMHYLLGSAKLIVGDTLTARLSLQRADSLGFKSANAKWAWGRLAEVRGDYPAAERYYRQALALESTSTENLAGLARSLLNQEKKAASALPIYQRLQRQDPTDATHWFWPGYFYFAQKDYARALLMFQEAVKRDPNNPSYQLMVGKTYFSLKQYQPAAEAFEEGFRLDSTNADYAVGAANIYAKLLKQPDRAFRLASRGIRLDLAASTQPVTTEKQKRIDMAVAILYANARQAAQYEEAIYWQKRMLAASPKSPLAGQYNYQIGDGYEKLNRLAEATKHLQEAIRLSPNEINYRNLLATALLRDNKPAKAETEARYVVRLDSVNLSGNSTLALALLRQGRYAKAWQVIQRVERITPADSWEAPYLYARWYARQRNVSEALRYLETTLKRGFATTSPTHIQTNPDFDPIRQNEGYILLMQHYLPPEKK